MGRRRRATRARIENLKKKKKNNQIDSYAVLDEPDILDANFPTSPSDNNSEDSVVEILDGARDTNIHEETELTRFSRFLHDAQKRALADGNKRKAKAYTGHSRATAHRRKRLRSDLAAQGFLSVPESMNRKKPQKAPEVLPVEESEESSGNENEALVSRLQDNKSVPSWSANIDDLIPAVSVGHFQDPTTSEQHLNPAASWVHHETGVQAARNLAGMEGPGRHQVTQQVPREEEEESTGSEDEDKGTAWRTGRTSQDKNGTRMGAATPFEDIRRRVLMDSEKHLPPTSHPMGLPRSSEQFFRWIEETRWKPRDKTSQESTYLI